MKRMVIVVVVALAVIVPGALVIRYWPRAPWQPRMSQAPAVEPAAAAAPGTPNPLASFDVREVGRAGTRVKLWVTPPGTGCPYGVEFTRRSGDLTAIVQRRGSAEHTPVPVAAGWVDRLNAAVRHASARPAQGGVEADLAVEHPGKLPEKYRVRFDPEGPGWTVLDEILSHYGLLSYTVKKGDTPARIAKQLLGDSRRWPEILAVNPGLKPDKMQPGDVIHLPRK